jgi:hypothetical protein
MALAPLSSMRGDAAGILLAKISLTELGLRDVRCNFKLIGAGMLSERESLARIL